MSSFWIEQPDPDQPVKLVVSESGNLIFCDHCPCCSELVREARQPVSSITISLTVNNVTTIGDTTTTYTISGSQALSRVPWSPNMDLRESGDFFAVESDCCSCRIAVGQISTDNIGDAISGAVEAEFEATTQTTTEGEEPEEPVTSTFTQAFAIVTTTTGAKGPCKSYGTSGFLPYFRVQLLSFLAGTGPDITGSYSTNLTGAGFTGLPDPDPADASGRTARFRTNPCVSQGLFFSGTYTDTIRNFSTTLSITVG